MSNNEIFEYIFESVSHKIVKQYLTRLNIVKDEDTIRYSNNLRVEQIISSLNENLVKISNYLIKHMQIADENSVRKILSQHINSKFFKKSLNQLVSVIETDNKLTLEEIRKTYSSQLKYYLMSNNVKEKIFALSKDATFQSWIEKRWKVIGCGYLIVILILSISYYVFISE